MADPPPPISGVGEHEFVRKRPSYYVLCELQEESESQGGVYFNGRIFSTLQSGRVVADITFRARTQ